MKREEFRVAYRHRTPRKNLFRDDPFCDTERDYVRNLLVGLPPRYLEAGRRAHMIADLQLVGELVEAARGPAARKARRGEPEGTSLVKLRAYVRKQGGRIERPRPPRPPVAGNLAVLAKALDLGAEETEVLCFIIAIHLCRSLRELIEALDAETRDNFASAVATATALPWERCFQAVSPSSRLIEAGVLGNEASFSASEVARCLPGALRDAVTRPGLDRQALFELLVPQAEPPTLDWSDFAHLGAARDMARDILLAGARDRRRGVNLLLYGPPGTGKTEFARSLAAICDLPLHAVGRTDSDGGSPTTFERLGSLLLGQRLFSGGGAILLFDELDDLFESSTFPFAPRRRRPALSKQWFNRALETNAAPTIWIINEPDDIDPAFLRRFSLPIEFTALGPQRRAAVLRRHLGDGDALPAEDVEAIALRFESSPAEIGNAVALARLVGTDGQPARAAIEQVLAPMERLLTGADPSRRQVFDPRRYSLDAVSCSEELEAVADKLAAWKPTAGAGVSLCFYGPPGTGKSEYAKYLAHRMGRPIVYRRASDLLGCYVGQTEKQVAAAFRQAERDDALLLIDEVDSFLRTREAAHHSWELSMTNELLQQLESCRGVVVCTTNLWKEIDAAALRRFVFKVEFRFLGAEQAVVLFRTLFAELLAAPLTEEDEASVRVALERLTRLAPGDFAAVARRERCLGRRSRPEELVARLVAEVRAKGEVAQAVGF